jgi:hypothetical protein
MQVCRTRQIRLWSLSPPGTQTEALLAVIQFWNFVRNPIKKQTTETP